MLLVDPQIAEIKEFNELVLRFEEYYKAIETEFFMMNVEKILRERISGKGIFSKISNQQVAEDFCIVSTEGKTASDAMAYSLS